MEVRPEAKRGTVLFVDDERRVLTSMRAMFRRDYDVLLANSGPEALSLLDDHEVDVIVSDQRMPGMTGVEVLKQVKELAPASMRILLTGYADLKAIEDSINEGEVFRYLTKPCPSDELKAAVALATEAAQQSRERHAGASSHVAAPETADIERPLAVTTTGLDADRGQEEDTYELIELLPVEHASSATYAPVGQPTRAARSNGAAAARTPVAERDSSDEHDGPSAQVPQTPMPEPKLNLSQEPATQIPKPKPPVDDEIRDVDLLALSADRTLSQTLEQALDGSHRVHVAATRAEAIAALESNPIGVLVTDMAGDRNEIGELTTALKRHVPDLVAIVASDRSDAQMLIDLINYGQIFRFLLKPLHAGQCRLSVESAVARHRELRADPSLAKRHAVAPQGHESDGVIRQVLDRVRRVRARFFTVKGVV